MKARTIEVGELASTLSGADVERQLSLLSGVHRDCRESFRRGIGVSDPIRATRLSMRQAQGISRCTNAAAVPCPLGAPKHRGADEAAGLLLDLFHSFDGSVALRLWGGATLRFGKNCPHKPAARHCYPSRRRSLTATKQAQR